MIVRLAGFLLAFLLTASSAFCDLAPRTVTERVKLLSGETFGGGDQFGNAVALSRDTLLVGAYQDEPGGAGSHGVIRMYEEGASGEWLQTARLGSSESGAQLGWSVGISGKTAVAGARLADLRGTNSGSMTVFEQNAAGDWSATRTLVGGDILANDQFGISVGIDRSTIVAGSSSHNFDEGAAFVFQNSGSSGWSEVAKLTAADPQPGEGFGVSVAISGNTVIAGASGRHEVENWSGAAYVFQRNDTGDFLQAAKLRPADVSPGMAFGRSVSIAGETALVGAPGLKDFDRTGGSAYLFARDLDGEWTQRAKLIAGEQFVGDQFGISVALGKGIAVVGSPGHDDLGSGGGTDPGTAYVFRESVAGDWMLSYILKASDASAGDGFGRSVAIYGSRVLVGAQFNDDKGSASGSAYLFVVPEPASAVVLLAVLFGVFSGRLLRDDGASPR